MRTSGILIMAGGLILGICLAVFFTSPGEGPAPASPESSAQDATASLTPDFPEGRGPKERIRSQSPMVIDQPKPGPVREDAFPVAPPADGQKIECADGLTVYWVRGGNQISGWRKGKRAWSRELAFAMADVVRGATPDELRVGSVDALSLVVLDASTGTTINASSVQKGQGGEEAVAGLLAQVKTLHADALARMRAGDGRGTVMVCDQMGQLAQRLSEAKRQDEAFRVWAAAKKLRRAVAPEQIGRELPKEQQPGPEDLEF